MDIVSEYMDRIQKIIEEIRAQLPSLPEPQRTQAEQRLQEMERIASDLTKK